MTNYEERLLIPISGPQTIKLYTPSKTLICNGYQRIVIGDRGPYIEFDSHHIIKDSMRIPESCKWRINHRGCYYIEYRTCDDSYVMVYYQKKLVDYANYRPAFYYISPFDLVDENSQEIILPGDSK